MQGETVIFLIFILYLHYYSNWTNNFNNIKQHIKTGAMAELVDALVLGTSRAIGEGSGLPYNCYENYNRK